MEDVITQKLDITEWETAKLNGDGSMEVPDEAEGSRVVERPPRIHREHTDSLPERARRFVEERRNRTTGKTGGAGKAVKKATPKIRPVGPRVDTSKVIEWGWAMLARMAAPVSVPVARTLAMQAPVAGEILEDTVKDTALDRVLQPFARIGDGSEAVVALLAPPILVGVMHKNPKTVPALTPLLRSALVSWVKIAGPKLEARQQEETEFEEKYGQTVDMMMAGIFEGIAEPEEESAPTVPPIAPPAPMPTPVTVEDEPPIPTMPHPMRAPVRPTQRGTKIPPAKRTVKKAATDVN